MSAEWHFVEHRAGQPIVNPLGSEHFAEADDDWRPGEGLVRECIQNSMDARCDEAVSVCFQVRGSNSMSAETAAHWFTTLWPHLRSNDCKLPDVAASPPAGGFLVVEDFGTRGLEGDVRQGGLSDTDNRFFNFFRAEGLSGNPMHGTAGGSWGVGKSVFNRCSTINTFLALSGRRAHRDVALIGKSLLWHHRIARGEFHGLGQFGSKDPSNEFLVLPGTDDATIRRFATDFRLSRPIERGATEPGLSVVVPYADSDITAESIVDIVIREYFHPIIAGRLSVRVSGLIAGKESSVNLHQDNLLEQAAVLQRAGVMRVLELAQWSLGDGPRQAYVLEASPADDAPAWDDELLRPEDPAFRDLCQRFDRGDPIAIRVPLRVRSTGKKLQRAWFTVYLQRDLTGSGYRPVFVRGCIVVPNARQRAVRNHSVFSLIIIDDGPLAAMLRAAEPPAHTSWSADTANFRGRYEHGKQTIDFLIRAPKYLTDALSNARSERDLDVWADLFPSPVVGGERDAGGKRGKGRRRSRGPIEPPRPRPKPFRIHEITGGFSVARDNAETTPLPALMEVLVAYDTSRGNPLKKYHPADFKLQNLNCKAQSIQVDECLDNRFVFRPTSDDFRIDIAGLDVNRDLVVRVRTHDTVAGGDA